MLAALADRHPGVRIALTEQSRDEVERSFPADGVVVAVLPTLPHPLAPGLQEQLLWREPIRLVVNPDHELARLGKPVPVDELVRFPLIVCGTAGEPEVRQLLAARGLRADPRVLVDTPQSLVAMARVGVGVGVANAVALEHADTAGLVVLDIDDPDLVREVAAYWYDVLAEHRGRRVAAARAARGAGAARGDAPPAARPDRRRAGEPADPTAVGSDPSIRSRSRPGVAAPRAEDRCPRSSAASPSSPCCGPGWPPRWPGSRRSCTSRARPASARPR